MTDQATLETPTGTPPATAGTGTPATGTPSLSSEAPGSETPGSKDWFSALGESWQNNPVIANHKGKPIDSLLSQHDAYAKHFGAPADQILRLPKADDQAGWETVYNRLGRPETPDKYDFGVEIKNPGDLAFVESFRADAHKLGITQTQMQAMMKHVATAGATVDEQLAKQEIEIKAATEAELNKAWGAKKSIYDAEVPKTIEKLAIKAGLYDPAKDPEGGKKIIEALNADGLTNNATLMRLMGAVSDMLAEPENPIGQGDVPSAGAAGVADAKAKKSDLYNNADTRAALENPTHARHKETVAERDRLNAIIAAG